MSLSKIAFFKAYQDGEAIVHAKIDGKWHSLSKELYYLRKHMRSESCTKDGRRLFRIAFEIYHGRRLKESLCRRIIEILKNVFSGRGFVTERRLYNTIENLAIMRKFNLYEHSHQFAKRPAKKLAPRKLPFA